MNVRVRFPRASRRVALAGVLAAVLAIVAAAGPPAHVQAACDLPPGATPGAGGPPCPRFPDLLITNFQVTRLDAQTVQITFQVKNQGTAAAPPLAQGVALGVWGQAPIFLGLTQLAPGEAYLYQQLWSVPLSRDLKMAVAGVNPMVTIAESNYANNWAKMPFQ